VKLAEHGGFEHIACEGNAAAAHSVGPGIRDELPQAMT
jgi:hypothetical protein